MTAPPPTLTFSLKPTEYFISFASACYETKMFPLLFSTVKQQSLGENQYIPGPVILKSPPRLSCNQCSARIFT